MNVPQDELNSLRALAKRAKDATYNARIAPPARRGDHLETAGHLCAQLETRLMNAGADAPEVTPAPLAVRLEHLDTAANRRYLSALREAWEAGLAVDRERYGEKIGTDGCAQAVELILRDVETECFGAVGRLRE
jgi:hypothetical protein